MRASYTLLAALGLLVLACTPALGQQQCMLTAAQIRKIDLKPAAKACQVRRRRRRRRQLPLPLAEQLPPLHGPMPPPCALASRLQSSDAATLCDACVCSIAESVLAAIGDVEVDASAIQAMPQADIQAAIMACAPALLPKFASAGIGLGSLMRLQSCKALPPCLADLAR